jgi:hypothetical protein
MAYSKVRWISTSTFLACVGGAHGRGEGANVRGREWLRWGREQPRGSLSHPYAPHSLLYAPLMQAYAPLATPTIQRGSDVAATVDKVSPDLPCPRSTRR